MNYKKIYLENSGYGKTKPMVTAYLQETISCQTNYQRPALIVCPGGGYEFTSERESEPIALAFLNQGYQVFVLDYTVLDKNEQQPLLPYPLYDLAKTIAMIRNHCKEWIINSHQITILGCSAGGHLCANYSNTYTDNLFQEKVGLSCEEIAVNACILCYPVIDLTAGWPDTSTKILPITNEKKYCHPQKLVSAKTPPTFIWHTVTDIGVPAKNTMLYSLALLEHNVDHECHTYHLGKHGLSLANHQSAKMITDEYINKHVATWFELANQWLKEIYKII